MLLALTFAIGQSSPPFEEMPKVDIHAHYFNEMPEFVNMLERSNMKVVNICVFKNRPQLIGLLHERATYLAKKYAPTIHFACTFDLTRVDDADFVSHTVRWLDEQFDSGAIMMKVWKR